MAHEDSFYHGLYSYKGHLLKEAQEFQIIPDSHPHCLTSYLLKLVNFFWKKTKNKTSVS